MIVKEKIISTRAKNILERFPRHLDLAREDKVFAKVVNALAKELDVKTMQLGRVRKSHRLSQADEIRDLLLLAGFHRLKPINFEITNIRLNKIAAEASVLLDEGADQAAKTEALQLLAKLLPIADFGDYKTPDNFSALGEALLASTGYLAKIKYLRQQIKDLIRIHRQGNGSVGSLLEATAAYLNLKVNRISHVGDDYWHIGYCDDLIKLRPAEDMIHLTHDDWLALEENPFKEVTIEPAEFSHAQVLKIVRSGFDPVPVSISITGIEDRTCWPMLVDINKGHGLYYAGNVANDSVLEFTADGRVLLDGADADNQAFSFDGAVFAEDKGQSLASCTDFAFCKDNGETPYGQKAVFVETSPIAEGFSANTPFLGGLSEPITLAVGASQLKFFVRIGHFGEQTTSPLKVHGAIESYSAGIFERSLFAKDINGAGADAPAALIGFDWQEREAFKAVIWLPSRLESFDNNDEPTLPDRLLPLLDRHRAAGIALEIKYSSDLWQLPFGYVTDLDSPNSYKSITAGSRLWNTGSPQPIT